MKIARELIQPTRRRYIEWLGTVTALPLLGTFPNAANRSSRRSSHREGFSESAVAVKLVNLDALIRREDFDIEVGPTKAQSVEGADKLKIFELEKEQLMYKWLRKPDFQRRTSHWPPEKVVGFIESFVSADLIPALILWQSTVSGSIFVIDGAHRLSALIAWVLDDYGDGNISLPFFEGHIPPEQKGAAEETRKMVGNRVGTYAEIKHSQNLSPEKAKFAGQVAAGGVTLQWVKGDATRAERSFHTINTEATPLGDLELRLIRDRHCPNAIATRALVAAGTGQYCRSSFSDESKAQIKRLAKEIYDDLFVPPLETPIKTLDLPVAGRSYSSDSVKMILDLVEYLNRKPPQPGTEKKRKKKPDLLAATMAQDQDGTETSIFLRNVRKASSRIAGTRPESLGLHPAVYFYSATGNYQPSAFLATISFVQGLESRNKLAEFTDNRKDFEELLLECKPFMNFIVARYGSGYRSLSALINLFQYLFDGAVAGQPREALLPTLLSDEKLKFLETKLDNKGAAKDFKTDRKSAVYLREALEKALRCSICSARIHVQSITVDHKVKRELGGPASVDNGQLAHPFCNTARDSLGVSLA